jgi:hypothetical protein
MDPRSQIRQALGQIPVSWLHMPSLAKASPDEPAEKFLPAIPPVVYAVVGGTLTGGALAAGGVALTRKGAETDMTGVVCNLTLQEIEDGAVKLYEASQTGKGLTSFQQIAETYAPAGTKHPLVAAFLGGVAAGASAVAVGARAGKP